MSEALDQLNAELSQCMAEIAELNKRKLEIEGRIEEQRLVEWLAYKNIDARSFPLNSEMREFIIKNGFPGGYIDEPRVLAAWSIGATVVIESITKSEQSIRVAPPGYWPGLFPPDMVVRAIKDESAL